MERSIRTLPTFLIMFALTSWLPLYAPLQTRLPNNFYLFSPSSSSNNLFDDTIAPRAFIIIVGNTNALPSKTPEIYAHLQNLFKNITFPTGLLTNVGAGSATLTLYFDWEDKVGFKNIREFGSIFAQGITQLTTKYNATPVIITLGRAGLMVNFASQQWKTGAASLPVLIQIGTPVPPRDELYVDLFPKSQTLRKLFHFYSTQPFVVEQPTLHPTYQSTYDNLPPLSTYNLMVLVNNNQPLQHKLVALQSLTNNVLHVCAQAQTTFLANKQLFVSISPRRPETDGLIGIAQPNTKTTSEQNKKELSYNNELLKTFTKVWSYGPRLAIPAGEFLRNSYKFHDE